MDTKIGILLNKLRRIEKGQALILVLVLLAVGGVMIAPLLAYMGTGVKTGMVFEEKTHELYAADAGVEDALWQIKYDHVEVLFPDYDEYDYTSVWGPYNLSQQVNDEDVAVTIQNTWIPQVDPAAYGLDQDGLREIVTLGNLTVHGSVPELPGIYPDPGEYAIRIDYHGEEELGELGVEMLGIWLPHGFSYVEYSSNLEADPFAPYYPDAVTTEPYAGGQAVVWSFGPLLFGDLPAAGPTAPPGSALVTFQFTSDEAGRRPEAISWIVTSGVPEVPFAWSSDARVYSITSAAGTTIEAHVVLSSAFSFLLDNAITSPGDVELQPGTTVVGNVQYNEDLVMHGDSEIIGDVITDPIDWPMVEGLPAFYYEQVAGLPWPYDPDPDPEEIVIDEDCAVDPETGERVMGPFYREGPLDIDNNGGPLTLRLDGTIYVAGDLDFPQPGGPDAYTIDLNSQCIFAEGSISFPSNHSVTLKGSGCIIARQNIDFWPTMNAAEGDYVLVMSLDEGYQVNFQPMGDFYGSLAGEALVNLQPDSSLIKTTPPGTLNFPGIGVGGSSGGPASTLFTIETWEID